MKLIINIILAIILGLIVALGVMSTMYIMQEAEAAPIVQSDKSDGECTGNERVGRCADKCPNQTDTLLGYNNNGVAICRPAPTGCPYGDSIPLGAECDKHAPKLDQSYQEDWGK